MVWSAHEFLYAQEAFRIPPSDRVVRVAGAAGEADQPRQRDEEIEHWGSSDQVQGPHDDRWPWAFSGEDVSSMRGSR